jgi:8-oxo-dGTP diphosphatase
VCVVQEKNTNNAMAASLDTQPLLPQLHVAVGVVFNNKREILITQRAQHKHEGGLWEFPGGKLEKNETALVALKRELYEEVGIIVQAATPLLQMTHNYPAISVLLDVWKVESFQGVARPRENQPLQWVTHTALAQFIFPAANQPIITAVRALFN